MDGKMRGFLTSPTVLLVLLALVTLSVLSVLPGPPVLSGLPVGRALAAEKVELTFWSWRTEDTVAYDKFIKAFEAKHPEITVKFMPYKNTEYNTILSAALQGGSGPDIVQLRSYGGFEPYAEAGYLVPLDEKVPALKDFPAIPLSGARDRKDGKVYGVPFAVQSLQIFYNKGIFSKFGLKEPRTWDEFLDVCKTLKSKGVIPLAQGTKDGWTLESMTGAVAPNFYGGTQFFNEVVKGKADFRDPRFVAGLKKLKELEPFFPPGYLGISYTDAQMMFVQEMAAMFIGGSYEVGYFNRQNPALKLGVFPAPPQKKGEPALVSVYPDGSFGISAQTKHLKEALLFINFLAAREFGQMFTDELKQISPIPGVTPVPGVMTEIVGLTKSSTPYIMLVGFRYGQPTGSVLLQNALQGMFAGKLTSEGVADEIHAGLVKWYQPFHK
ncbi:MAG: extracellular solute-binding protein [Firmicutes bacterium]|nr:extracellular solute-binding protein [Bacillota bacterium]